MPFRFHCEHCDVRIKVPDGSAGKKVKCPGCGQAQRIPVAAAPPTAAAVVPPKARAMAVSDAAVSDAAVSDETSSEQAVTKEKSEPKAAKDWSEISKKKRTSIKRADEASKLATEPAPLPKEKLKEIEIEEVPVVLPPVIEDEAADDDEIGVDDMPAPVVNSGQSNDALLAFLAETQGTGESSDETALSNEIADQTVDENATGNDGSNEQLAVEKHPAEKQAAQEEEVAPSVQASRPVADEVENATDQLTEAQSTEPTAEQELPSIMAKEPVSEEAVPQATEQEAKGQKVKEQGDNSQEELQEELQNESKDESEDESEEDYEGPAGEVRELFDDFVKREKAQRLAEEAEAPRSLAKQDQPMSVSASTTTGAASNIEKSPARESPIGEPVVKVKVPPRIVRQAETRSIPDQAVAASPEASSVSSSASRVASVPSAHRASPQAIPLSSSKSAAVDVAPSEEDQVEHDEQSAQAPQVSRAALASATSDSLSSLPLAKPRRIAPPPGFATLLALCWLLRILACVSIVSLVKLALLWIDAGAKVLDVIIVAPLGIGVVIALWALGEMARVVRITARNGSR